MHDPYATLAHWAREVRALGLMLDFGRYACPHNIAGYGSAMALAFSADADGQPIPGRPWFSARRVAHIVGMTYDDLIGKLAGAPSLLRVGHEADGKPVPLVSVSGVFSAFCAGPWDTEFLTATLPVMRAELARYGIRPHVLVPWIEPEDGPPSQAKREFRREYDRAMAGPLSQYCPAPQPTERNPS